MAPSLIPKFLEGGMVHITPCMHIPLFLRVINTFEFHKLQASLTTVACSNCLCFFDCASYALCKLQMTSISLKAKQCYSMGTVYDGHDAFIWLLTGYGKSLYYQAVPLILDFKLGLVGSKKLSLVLVVSPLIALMVDQATSLKKRRACCSIVTSSDVIDKDFLATDSSLSTDSLPFFAPEALVRSKWRYCIDDAEVS